MSDAQKNEFYFPMIIAITALVLSLISGVVNYRQNNLANLESSLRDTRDQLQLAKSDIADIRMKTVQKMVDAEMAYKVQERLEDEKNELRLDLADARERINELETQVKSLDQALEKKKTTAHRAETASLSRGSSTGVASEARPETADVDIYTVNIAESQQQGITAELGKTGFAAKFPEKRKSMDMANRTTVFYYHDSYKHVAERLVKALGDVSSGKVLLRKGASPFGRNKIVVHIIGG
ncbi:MAG: hypothetical protein AUJ57_09590 [Zetaproteobacteria bacterium CG1_02_53_45]|nr:MAG: hypothetical protein AUJ57_09590 [Zetaproteobacteria bacterium CG1_02_53_45]